MNIKTKAGHFWRSYNATIVLSGLVILFLAYSFFLALNLKKGVIPDEPAHVIFSEHYATTWGIPEDVPETYRLGWYIEQNPFLYYWLNGRALNILDLIKPSTSEWQRLVFLRLLDMLYALGIVLFCFLLSKEVIKHKWWQLLPVFLLTNTLMFVFLSGGVNYDNLANLLCMACLFFLVRIINHKDFLSNSLGWALSICLGTLVKYPILPLALATAGVWLIFTITHRKKLFPLYLKAPKWIALSLILLVVIFANLGIYGINLIRYQSVTPECIDLLSLEQCETSPFAQRFHVYGLDHKLSMLESIQLGYPNPLEYVIDTWFPTMLYRIYGIHGHLTYLPSHIIVIYRLLFFWMILLAFRYLKQPSFTIYSLVGVFLFYAFVLLYTNYNSELEYGFKTMVLQGRYIFPAMGAFYVLFGYVIYAVSNRAIRTISLISTMILFFAGGPIKFITNYNSIFINWFTPK